RRILEHILIDVSDLSLIIFTYLNFFFYNSCDHRDLHSFPTRRSSDLSSAASLLRISRVGSLHLLNFACAGAPRARVVTVQRPDSDRKSTRLNSSHSQISYAVFCLKKKKKSTTAIFPDNLKSSVNNSSR